MQDTYDEELLGAVAELLPIMASALGPQTYAPVFQQLVWQPLMKRFQPGQPDGVRSTMIGQLTASPCPLLAASMASFAGLLVSACMASMHACCFPHAWHLGRISCFVHAWRLGRPTM